MEVLPVGSSNKATVSRENDWFAWTASSGVAGGGFDLRVPAAAGVVSFTLADLDLSGGANVRQVYVGNWWLSRYFRIGEEDDLAGGTPAASQVNVRLDDPRLSGVGLTAPAGALQMDQTLQALDPGAQAEVVFRLEQPAARYFIHLDPLDEVTEIREGNNSAVYRSQPRPVMVALHTHASLSEGTASLDAQMDFMTRTGYDAVFWTEHDWRLTGAGNPRVFGFEEEMDQSTWRMVPRRLDPGIQAEVTSTTDLATEGTHSVEFFARRKTVPGGPVPQAAWSFRTYRGRHIRALAQGLSLALDIHPDPDNPFGSEFILDLELSDQPRVHRRLRYRLEAVPRSGAARQVVLPAPAALNEPSRAIIEPGRWTRVVIPISRHAEDLFPEGLDNALTGIQFGLAMHDGAARWQMDNLEMEAAVSGDPLLALQETWTGFYPAVASHVSAEISYYVPHFNAYTDRRFLMDYDAVSQEDYIDVALAETRRRLGAFSLTHPLGFGLPYPERHLEDEIRHRLFGADLLEVGYRFRGGSDLSRHLAFWDRALGEGIPASGIGVTDAHGAGRGNGFYRDENNFATWLGWFGGATDARPIDPASRESLIDGLMAGSLVFGDPLLFNGRLRLDVDDVHGPGAVLLGSTGGHDVVVQGEDLPAGGQARLIVDGRLHASGNIDQEGQLHLTAPVSDAAGSVRAEIWDDREQPVAFTNAVLFLSSIPPEGLPAARLRAMTERGTLTGSGRYRVEQLQVTPRGLTLRGSGREGVLRMEGAGGEPAVVSAIDSGTPVSWTYDAATDVLVLPLRGSGLNLRWSSPALELARSSWTLLGLAGLALALVLWLVFRPRPEQA